MTEIKKELKQENLTVKANAVSKLTYVGHSHSCDRIGTGAGLTLYSGTPLWSPWGPGEVSCIQWNPSIVDALGPGEVSCIERCPHFGVHTYIWDIAKCP